MGYVFFFFSWEVAGSPLLAQADALVGSLLPGAFLGTGPKDSYSKVSIGDFGISESMKVRLSLETAELA